MGLGGLDEVDALQLARHVAGEGQNRRMVAAGFIEAGDQMRASGARGAGADRETAGKLGLAGGGQSSALLMAHPDPFDAASSDRVRERIERVPDQPENLLHANLLERTYQDARNRLRPCRLLAGADAQPAPPAALVRSQWDGRALLRHCLVKDQQ